MSVNSNLDNQIKFKGKATEYFGIWITNILFTILTLGIYSAWAKVRTKKYFYSNTFIHDESFDYHASPIVILKSRALVFFGYLIFIGSQYIWELFPAILLFLFILLLPFIIVNAIKFNLVNTSYRSIRMNFKGVYNKESNKVYLLYPFLAVITLGLLRPYIAKKSNEYYLNNLRFGTSLFTPKLKTKDFIGIYLAALALILLLLGLGFIAYYWLLNALGTISPDIMSFVPFIIIIIAYVPLAFIAALTRNYIFNNTILDKVKFSSNMTGPSLIFLYITNLIMIIASFGLLIPYIKIRNARYYASRSFVGDKEQLDQFLQATQKKVNALGDSASDILDVDFDAIG